MNDNEYDGLPDNDWDDAWELAWSEFDWERYLRDQDAVIQAYLNHYDKVVDRPDRIDEVAHLMGWDEEDWTSDESEVGEDSPPVEAEAADAFAQIERPDERDASLDPYTIQKHPVYISTHALFFWLQRTWEFVAPTCGNRIPMRTALAVSSSLAQAEHHGLLATHSLDMGDFSLAVSQIKRGMSELNAALRHLDVLGAQPHRALDGFRRQAMIRFFDIREIWLRVMRDCRAELDRRVGEGEN